MNRDQGDALLEKLERIAKALEAKAVDAGAVTDFLLDALRRIEKEGHEPETLQSYKDAFHLVVGAILSRPAQ